MLFRSTYNRCSETLCSKEGTDEASPGQSDLSPIPSGFPSLSYGLSLQTADCEAYRALQPSRAPHDKARATTSSTPGRGARTQRAEPAGRPLPGCALTTHRAPSWSPGRRSRASEASSPATQMGQGLRPPDPAFFAPKAATSTDTLNYPASANAADYPQSLPVVAVKRTGSPTSL